MVLDDIYALCSEVCECDRLLAAYDLVIADACPDAEEDGVYGYLRQHLVEWRTEVSDERDSALAHIATLQEQCSHAYEKIGEARPPFWRCVRCERTRADEPGCGRSATP
jgi:hypothetical protein